MPSNPNNTTPVSTPGGNLVPSQQTYPPEVVPYIENGLVYQSNNPDFVERDDNGNIIVNQGATDNQNLVLEATSLYYVNRSVVSNIDTRFKYFRFPAENVAVPEISFEGFGIDDLVSAQDFVYAKYKPSENRPATSTTLYSGILMNQVLDGISQENVNAYTITPQIKELAVDGIRMRIQLRHRYSQTGIDIGNSRFEPEDPGIFGDAFSNFFGVGGIYDDYIKEDFSALRPEVQAVITDAAAEYSLEETSITPSGWWNSRQGSGLISFNEKILRGTSYDEAISTLDLQSYKTRNILEVWNTIRDLQNSINKGTIYFSLIKGTATGNLVIRNFRELTVDAGNSTAFINANSTKISEYDITIPNEDFLVGDRFNIGVLVGQVPIDQLDPPRFVVSQHTILSDGSVWSITDASKNVDADNNEII